MHISVRRSGLLGISRKLARLLPGQSPIADLTGILMEADENDGSLRLVATNLEVTLQYRIPAIVAEGGRMVVNGKLLASMIPLLSDDQVIFRSKTNSAIARIENGRAIFEISCLSGSHYPESEIAPPGSMATIHGLASLAGQTAFSATKKAKFIDDMLANAKLEISPSELRMTCTDGVKLAIARRKREADSETEPTSMQLLIPTKSLPLISDVCGDEAVSVGISGTTLVFSGANYRYSTRTMAGIYPDTNALLAQIKPAYSAIVEAAAFWAELDRLSVMAEPGDTVRLSMGENGIALSYQQEHVAFSSMADAVVYTPTPDSGFHYGVNDLFRTLRYMEGNLSVVIDHIGNMLLKTRELCYLITPRRQRKAAVKPEDKNKESKPKTTRRKKAA